MLIERGTIAATAVPVGPEWFERLRGKDRDFFSQRFAKMANDVRDAHRDGLDQLVPIILVMQQNVTRLRAQLGRSAWRAIHHASEMTNFMRALLWMKHAGKVPWTQIVEIPEHHLRSCRNAIDWPTAYFAARHATPGQFAQLSMLYRDTLRMGATPNPAWSLKRLRREHDALALRAALEDVSATPWAAPFEFEQDGYLFKRLISDRDFTFEGKVQRHCVASYREDAKAGRCIVMRCSGAERATYRFGGEDGTELRGFANADVTQKCAEIARAAQAAFDARQT